MRKFFIIISTIIIVLISILSYVNIKFIFLGIIFFPLILMGIYDMIQTKKTILRNFPLLGRMRYLLESIGPEIRQYFVETDLDGKPFNRQRSEERRVGKECRP